MATIVQFVADFISVMFHVLLEYVDANATRATTITTSPHHHHM
jgi:hypothetical protein